MPAAPKQSDLDLTRQRLLEAAGRVFADQGYKDATVREICKSARANVAAINYHFGDKERLYAATVKYAHSCQAPIPTDLDDMGGSPAEERLTTYLKGMLTGILDEGRPAWHAKLIAREMAEPTGVLQHIIANVVRPRFQFLAGIVRSYVGEDAPEAVVARCVRSIVGQVLFYHFARPLLVRMFVNETFDLSAVDALARHVATFSVGGLRNTAKSLAVPKGKKGAGR